MSSKTRKDEEVVNDVLNLHKNMNEMTVDRINEMAPQAEEKPHEMSAKERAQLENAMYIEPKRKLKAFGTLPEKLKREHAYAWEYVKGIFENHIVNSEPIKFWLSLFPGDPDCLWEIPPNRPVYVPRHVAQHLEEVMKYHEFDYIVKKDSDMNKDGFMENFAVTGTKYRGKFRPVGAFR